MTFERYDDFDAYVAKLRDADVSCLPQAIERREWQLDEFSINGLHVQFGGEGGGIVCTGRARSDGLILFLPLTHAAAHSINGEPLDDDALVAFGPGAEFHLGIRAPHKWCTLFVPTEVLTKRLAGNPQALEGARRPRCRTIRPPGRTLLRLRDLMRAGLRTAHDGPDGIAVSASARALAGELVLKAVEALVVDVPAMPDPRPGRPVRPREEVLRIAKLAIERSTEGPVPVADLAAASDVCERTLRTIFLEFYGVGPARYQKLQALQRVRCNLLAARNGQTTVTAVLSSFGIWQHGRFAAEYRRQYGEYPACTLARPALERA